MLAYFDCSREKKYKATFAPRENALQTKRVRQPKGENKQLSGRIQVQRQFCGRNFDDDYTISRKQKKNRVASFEQNKANTETRRLGTTHRDTAMKTDLEARAERPADEAAHRPGQGGEPFGAVGDVQLGILRTCGIPGPWAGDSPKLRTAGSDVCNLDFCRTLNFSRIPILNRIHGMEPQSMRTGRTAFTENRLK